MEQYILKSALVAEIERRKEKCDTFYDIALSNNAKLAKVAIEEQKRQYNSLLSFLDTIEVIDPYEQRVQHSSIKDGIKAHAKTYSFNIESELFNQLTKEQQALWRKEIEQACISGGEVGVELARDIRYKENVEVKKVDLITHTIIVECCDWLAMNTNLSHDKIEECRNLILTVKEEQFKAQKGV